jgi:cyclophilin family peptidyl-prolyl cis-trans isomerase
MAKQPDDPDSATSQWFVSIGDNSDNLDNQNGGFTVFGRITQSTLASAESFGNPAEFPVYRAGGAFTDLPLNLSYDPDELVVASDLILFTSVELAPIDPSDAGESTTLTYSVAENSNPLIVSAQINPDGSLQLDYAGDSAGSSQLTIRATDSVGNTVDDSFVVTVGLRTYANWRVVNFTSDDRTDDAISGPTAGTDDGGLSNLERYLHGFDSSAMGTSPVMFSNTTLLGERYPTFTLPIRNDLNDVSIEIEESGDLGVTDPWTPTPFEEVSRDSNGPIDTLKIRGTAPDQPESQFFRLRFTLAE